MNVEVLAAAPRNYAPSAIPEILVDYYKAQGKRLSLTLAHSSNLAERRAEGRLVVLAEDMPEELVKAVRHFFDSPKKWDGEFHVGDCVLVAQTMENHEFWQQEIEARRQAMEESERVAEDLYEYQQGLLRKAGAPPEQSKTWVDFHPTHATKISDHVKGGPDLAAQIQAAEAAAGKKK